MRTTTSVSHSFSQSNDFGNERINDGMRARVHCYYRLIGKTIETSCRKKETNVQTV